MSMASEFDTAPYVEYFDPDELEGVEWVEEPRFTEQRRWYLFREGVVGFSDGSFACLTWRHPATEIQQREIEATLAACEVWPETVTVIQYHAHGTMSEEKAQ